MIDYDIHLHSFFSTDSEENQENIIEHALSLGLKGICFTDHMDLYFPLECSKKSGGDFNFDLDKYLESLSTLKEKYGKRIEVLIGMEIGLRDEPELKEKCLKEYEEMLNSYPFDFIIGSTHCLENIDPYWEEYWYGRTAEEGLGRYFDAIDKNVSYYSCFDSLGHLDYLVRYVSKEAVLRSLEKKGLDAAKLLGAKEDSIIGAGSFEPAAIKRLYGREIFDPMEFMDQIEGILKKIIDSGKALEINSAGIKYGLGFAHPKKEILKRYRELGGELITIGSDAHKAEHLAYDFSSVHDLLKSLGYKYYFVYKDRSPKGYIL